MNSLTAVATLILLLVLNAQTRAQDPKQDPLPKPQIVTLPAMELGELVDVDAFVGRRVIVLRFEFENGIVEGIWGVGGQSIVRIATGDGVRFQAAWDGRGRAVVGYLRFAPDSVPDVDDWVPDVDEWFPDVDDWFPDVDEWFVAWWRTGARAVRPRNLAALFFDPGTTMAGGFPLLMHDTGKGGVTIRLDTTSAAVQGGSRQAGATE